MTKLIHMSGDIFTTSAQGIGHGVNVQGVMGAGIAKQFRDKFPTMFEEYRQACIEGSLRPGEILPFRVHLHPDDAHFIYNIASQDKPGRNAQYDWLIQGVGAAMIHAEELGVECIALPRIGSGIGGLDEKLVESALTVLAEMLPVDIELWTYQS